MKVFYWVIFAVFSMHALAQEPDTSDKLISGHNRYISLGYGWNYPVFKASDKFLPSIGNTILGFNHLSEDWLLGVSVHFKFFQDREDGSKLSLWTLEQHSYYRTRLYYPLYLLSGGKFLYLYPVQKGTYPFKKRIDLKPEVGISASLGLLYLISEKFALVPYADLWRGTGSRKFEGIELGLNLLWSFL